MAILKNHDAIYGRTVLDVGAGTGIGAWHTIVNWILHYTARYINFTTLYFCVAGILSMFCVLAGARKGDLLIASMHSVSW